MNDQDSTWPEQDAIDAWFKEQGLDFRFLRQKVMELKKAVTAPRLRVQDERATLEARVKELTERRDTLFDAIKHGDAEHEAWLQEAIKDHFEGLPVDRPAGKGSTERIATLEAQKATIWDQYQAAEARVKELENEVTAYERAALSPFNKQRIEKLEGELAESIKRNDDLAATNRRLGNRLIEKHKN